MIGRLAIAAICTTGLTGQALAKSGCVERHEAETVVTAMLPALIGNVREACMPILPADAALSQNGEAMVVRLNGAAEMVRAQAGEIAVRLMLEGEDPPPPEMLEPELILGTLEAAMTVEVASGLDADDCAIANDFFSALEPLPAPNLARLVVIFLDIGSRNDDEAEDAGPFTLCRA